MFVSHLIYLPFFLYLHVLLTTVILSLFFLGIVASYKLGGTYCAVSGTVKQGGACHG